MHKLEEVIAFLARDHNPSQGGEGNAKPGDGLDVDVRLICHEVGERIGRTVAYIGGGVILSRPGGEVWVNFHDVISATLVKGETNRAYR